MSFGISHYEMQGYPKSRWKDGHFYGTRKVRVAWYERDDFLEQLDTADNNGWPYVDGPTAYALARHVTIEPLPAKITGTGTGSSQASYEWALITIEYTTKGPQSDGHGAWIEEWIKPFVRYMRIDQKGLTWAAGAAAVEPGDAPALVRYGLEYHRKYHRLPSVPWQATNWVGYVNSDALIAPTISQAFPAGTLLYAGADISTRVSMSKLQRYDVKYSFLYWPGGWNKFFNPATGTFDSINVNGVLFEAFPTISFNG